jgi:hypothetical protein
MIYGGHLVLGLCGVFLSTSALAADPNSVPAAPPAAAAKASGGEKRTTVNFEDQLIEGQTQKPELFYLLQQRNNNFKRLIKLRENFLPEMRKTAEDVSRNSKGSGN